MMRQRVMRPQADSSDVAGVWEDLVIAMLSVGGFPVEKVLKLRDSLERAGLVDPRNLSSWDEARVTRELTAAGYERGMLTGMYAERLCAAMRSLAVEECLHENQMLLERADQGRVADLLLPQKGIGPAVLRTFLGLRERRKCRSDPHGSGCSAEEGPNDSDHVPG